MHAEDGLAPAEDRASRDYLRELLNSTGEGLYAIDATGMTTTVNRAFLAMLGFDHEDEVVGRNIHGLIHHSRPDGAAYAECDCPVHRAATLGEAAHVEGERFFRRDGASIPVEYRARPVWRDGRLKGAICTFVDVSERLAAQAEIRAKQAELEEQTHALQILNRAAAAVAGDLDLERLVQVIVDAGVELSGAEFGAFFYNVEDDAGESYMLYTLSGAPREAFAQFPMPRKTAVFAPTFAGEGAIRSADITLDPRYGHNAPRQGMPEGHLPVRSYLAAPVCSRQGKVLGGLFFGHSRPGVFSDRSEERVVGLASQAAVAMDMAALFQAAEHEIARRCRAEGELQALNSGLEERVATETAERVRAEAALRQAQKMEAVGQLTGGVAHDFNNLLTIIIGGLDSIRRSAPGDTERVHRSAEVALQGAQRAASLTGRLLAFSRRQPLAPRRIELNALVGDMHEMLHRTLGEHIVLEGVFAPELWAIEADQNQLEAAIVNLAVNARDAMPEGGVLTIETANATLDAAHTATDAEAAPGPYVVIAVSDTGAGMSADTLSHAFEPFFTTKEVGRGTGLGLSMVYGFVKQSGGNVTIDSEVGRGTTVRMYFPRYCGAPVAEQPAEPVQPPRGRHDEVVLVVEDNAGVRDHSVAILTELGYRVLEAGEADSAMAILDSGQRIDLLFTDVVLPSRSGRELADAARTQRPELKVLYTTGYSRDAIVHHGRLDPGVQLIAKPFTFDQLAARVRDVLDQLSVSG
jgi:PAS domain S-box-containing protein